MCDKSHVGGVQSIPTPESSEANKFDDACFYLTANEMSNKFPNHCPILLNSALILPIKIQFVID